MSLSSVTAFAGRALLALLFFLAGLAKILGPEPFLAHMAEFNVPAFLLWPVIALEIGAGAALLLGWPLRLAAVGLAAFSIATAVVFHLDFAAPGERTLFFKDLAIAGGLLAIAASRRPDRRKSVVEDVVTGRTDTLIVDGVALHIDSVGEGPPVLCLHASGHDGHDFDALSQLLGKSYRFIRVDWPGQGRSGDDREAASADRYADLVEQLIDQLGLDKPVIIGNSIGGSAGIRIAARGRLRGLVLCDSGGLAEITPFVTRFCGFFEGFHAAGERGAWWYGPAFALHYQMVLTGEAAQFQRGRIVRAAGKNARVLREAWSTFGRQEADVRHIAAGLDLPVWVAWAKRDQIIPLKYCLPAIRRIPKHTLTAFKGGHAPFLEQPKAFASAFDAFMKGLPPIAAQVSTPARR